MTTQMSTPQPLASPQDAVAELAALLGIANGDDVALAVLALDGIEMTGARQLAARIGLPIDWLDGTTSARLSPADNQRLLGVAQVYLLAERLYGAAAPARDWMQRAAPYLPGKPPITPLVLATVAPGARLLAARIARTAHGVY